MKNEVRLFINDKEVEFSQDPKILLNYTEKEFRNPTVVRNSYTKQITVPGTPSNNDVFGHIWNLERIQDGMDFNPIHKASFSLFVDGRLFQRGYAKLDKVTGKDNGINYSFTLYGGLGSFLYNLTYEPDSDARKTLYSLRYTTQDGEPHPDLDFTMDKDSVHDAWRQINREITGGEPRWDVINFVPAYEGYPDFDADKVLINYNGMPEIFRHADTVDNVRYSTMLNGAPNDTGYSLATASEELTEWQTFDLRSYLQRPAISMYRIIQACCDPINNGGYQVKLDEHFFNQGNPYYIDGWMTLPRVSDLEGEGGTETEEVTGVTLDKEGKNGYAVNYTLHTLDSLSNVKMRVGVTFNPTGQTTAPELSTRRDYTCSNINAGLTTGTYIKRFRYNSGVIIRLDALDAGGVVVGKSKTYLLSGDRNYPGTDNPLWNYFPGSEGQDITWLQGNWVRTGGRYEFADINGNPVDLEFTFPSDARIATLRFTMRTNFGYDNKYAVYGSANYQLKDGDSDQLVSLYTSRYYSTTGKHTAADAMATDAVPGRYGLVVRDFQGMAESYEGIRSGQVVSAARLLSSGEKAPSDYLLSYLKMFGLYFYYDSTEESDDPERYPAGVVHIMDRDTFYLEDEVVDLEKRLDWSRNTEITPALAESKWYRFNTSQVDSQVADEYREGYNQEYGSQLINTNYNFNTETKDLYDNSTFKDGIMVWEKDKYFKLPVEQAVPAYVFNGLTYELFAVNGENLDSVEESMPVQTTKGWNDLNALGYENYDTCPRIQFHDKDRGNVDGSGVLVFYAGANTGRAFYSITDDVYDMIALNGGTPCWLMTASEYDASGARIAWRTRTLPLFTRDLTYTGLNGNIIHSWNFGHPRVIYAPETYTTDGDSIYDKMWRNYLRDLYDQDTRKLSCYVLCETDADPWPRWFRRFYWFRNGIWALNSIKDMNLGDLETVKMEFIKVQDMDNYKLDQIRREGSGSIILTPSTIPCSGGTLSGTVYLQGGGSWGAYDEIIRGEDSQGNVYYVPTEHVMTPLHGEGTTSAFILEMPQNPSTRLVNWRLRILDGQDQPIETYFTQEDCGVVSSLSISPEFITVSSSARTTMFTVTSENVTGVTPYTDADWVTLSLEGSALTVTFTQNTGDTREALIYVSGSTGTGVLTDYSTLTQSAADQSWELVWVRPNAQGDRTTRSYFDEDWWTLRAVNVTGLTVNALAPAYWVTGMSIEPGGATYQETHTVYAYFSENTGSTRSATIRVSGTSPQGRVSIDGTLTQDAGEDSWELVWVRPNAQGNRTATSYQSEAWWTLRAVNVTGLTVTALAPGYWVSGMALDPTGATYQETHTVLAYFSENTGATRTATIRVSGVSPQGRVTLDGTITQESGGTSTGDMEMVPHERTVAASDTSTTLSLNITGSVTNISVTSNQSWATVSRSGGVVTVRFSANTGSSSRVCVITAQGYAGGETILTSCQITQLGGTSAGITLTPAGISVNRDSGTSIYTYVVQGTVTGLTVTSNQSWATPVLTQGNNTVTVTRTKNTLTGENSSRTATITISGNNGAVSDSSTLTQEGNNLELSPDSLYFGYVSGEVKTMGVTSNNNWEITDITDD